MGCRLRCVPIKGDICNVKMLTHFATLHTQGRGSLHAHCCFWLEHKEDEARVASEIMAFVPAPLDADGKHDFSTLTGVDLLLAVLFITKQIHTCRPNGCRAADIRYCKYGFPKPQQPCVVPQFNATTQQFDYCRLHHSVSCMVDWLSAQFLFCLEMHPH
jgi:hypothetical protein